MQGRVEGTLLNLEDFASYLLDSLGDRPSVLWCGGNRVQNEETKGPLYEISWFTHTMTIYNTSAIVDSQGI